jgi:hypothetical protein
MEPGKYVWLGDTSLSAVLEGSLEHHREEHYEPLREWLRANGII